MSADLGAWMTHPMTLGIAAVVVISVLTTLEVLLRNLAELGNVRFQGILDDHEELLPLGKEVPLHLAHQLDALRWLQIFCVGLLWLMLSRFPGLGGVEVVLLGVCLPLGLVVLARLSVGIMGEDKVAALLRLLRPLTWAPLGLILRFRSVREAPPADEDEEDEEASEREIQAYLEAGEAAGIFEGEEGEFVESLVDFFDTVVREVMTPRTDMVTLPDTATHRELLETFVRSGKSRIPIYHDTIDRVLGVVHVRDGLDHVLRGSEPAVTELVRETLVVPEGKPLGELLRDFQQSHQQLAIVVDEYGGTSGLVTLEDVLEEIVGEIQDEHDPRPLPEWQEVSDGVYRMQGRASVELLEELFGVQVEEEEVDTIGGLVFARHGTVPDPGTEVSDHQLGLKFTVDEMQERRVVTVTVQRLQPVAPGTGEEEAG